MKYLALAALFAVASAPAAATSYKPPHKPPHQPGNSTNVCSGFNNCSPSSYAAAKAYAEANNFTWNNLNQSQKQQLISSIHNSVDVRNSTSITGPTIINRGSPVAPNVYVAGSTGTHPCAMSAGIGGSGANHSISIGIGGYWGYLNNRCIRMFMGERYMAAGARCAGYKLWASVDVVRKELGDEAIPPECRGLPVAAPPPPPAPRHVVRRRAPGLNCQQIKVQYEKCFPQKGGALYEIEVAEVEAGDTLVRSVEARADWREVPVTTTSRAVAPAAYEAPKAPTPEPNVSLVKCSDVWSKYLSEKAGQRGDLVLDRNGGVVCVAE